MKVLIIEDEQHNFNRQKKLLLGYDATMLVEDPLETIDETRGWLHNHQGNEAYRLIFFRQCAFELQPGKIRKNNVSLWQI